MRDRKVTTDEFVFSEKSDRFKYENFNLVLSNETNNIVVFDGNKHYGGFSVGSKYGSDICAMEYLADTIGADYETLVENRELKDYIQRMVKKKGGYLKLNS